ncbi:hypothetical protein DPMN_087202 [Dreissena polymorpha]|uniref:Uncharacterized protein n=1 Tax=Dreissena polymorpha TaxID=45954 RepID=A0A9D4QV98_DREPO|nr:hypothetical protein DPMN_087202 [Dreissena polymorpha]
MVSCYTACTTGLTRLSAQHSDTSKHIRLSSTHGSDVVIVHGFYNRRPYPDSKRNIPTHDVSREEESYLEKDGRSLLQG